MEGGMMKTASSMLILETKEGSKSLSWAELQEKIKDHLKV